jgi:tRNA threonylcarbamoyladenosine biosynthesis protein TsaE
MRHALEWEDSGFKDLLTSPGINLIEWPEKAENTLPTPCLQISIEYLNENQRFGTFIASNLLGQKIINTFSNGS